MTLSTPDAVAERWARLLDFWREYDDGGVDWSPGAVPTLDALVHPRDLGALRRWRRDGAFSAGELRNLEDFLLSRMPPHTASVGDPTERAPSPGSEPRAVLPQPYCGDAVESRVVVVANNPGYDMRMCSEREDADATTRDREFAEAVEDQLRHRRRLAGEHVDPPWVTEPPRGYYRQKICPGSARPGYRVEWLLPIAAEFEEKLYGQTLFYAGFVPYQSADGGDPFVQGIRRRNRAGALLPSQSALLDLLGAMIRDEDGRDRVVVFRKRETLEWVESCMIAGGRCSRDDFAERVTMIAPRRAQRWQLNAGCLEYRVPALERLLSA